VLISNPAASPAFLPTAICLVSLLLASLGTLVVVEGRRLGDSVLFARWKTWALIAPIYFLAVLSGPVVGLLFVGVLSFQALHEYAAMLDLPPLYHRVLLAMGLLPGVAALLGPEAHAALPTLLLLAATLQPLLTADVRAGTRRLALAVFGWAYLPWLLSYLLLIQRDLPGGSEVLLALGLAVALSDVGAFTLGKLIGHRKLAPTLSPNKTWGGVIGNLLGAALGLALLAFALPAAYSGSTLAGLALLIALGAVWGDLLESLIKRECGAKDASTWLPGFGGLLDRIDSLIVVLPLSYYYLRWTAA
jgi:phosphatidate cytidylyltransferase